MTMRMMRNLQGLPKSSEREPKRQAPMMMMMVHGQPQVHGVSSKLWSSLPSLGLEGIDSLGGQICV